jgi:hypothetical protein
MKHGLIGLGFGGVVLVLMGCGGPTTYQVSGKVTFNGEPIQEGHIAFVPESPGPGGGGPISNGQYSVRTQAGKNKVQITASKKVPLPAGQVGASGEKEELRSYIPAKYNANSELKVDITGSATHDFDLKAK